MSAPRARRPLLASRLPGAADRADLAGVLSGDERSFERLVERHHAELLLLAAAHGVTGEEASQALVRTWSAFLDVVGAAEPVVGVRLLVTALLLDEVAAKPCGTVGG